MAGIQPMPLRPHSSRLSHCPPHPARGSLFDVVVFEADVQSFSEMRHLPPSSFQNASFPLCIGRSRCLWRRQNCLPLCPAAAHSLPESSWRAKAVFFLVLKEPSTSLDQRSRSAVSAP